MIRCLQCRTFESRYSIINYGIEKNVIVMPSIKSQELFRLGVVKPQGRVPYLANTTRTVLTSCFSSSEVCQRVFSLPV
jgi:hypothetical protein